MRIYLEYIAIGLIGAFAALGVVACVMAGIIWAL